MRLAACSLQGYPIQFVRLARAASQSGPRRHTRVPAAVAAFLQKLNTSHLESHPGETELEARIRNFELAQETAATRERYGFDNPATAGYGTHCCSEKHFCRLNLRTLVSPSERAGSHVFPWPFGVGSPVFG